MPINIKLTEEQINSVLRGNDTKVTAEGITFILILDEDIQIYCLNPNEDKSINLPVQAGELLDILEEGATFDWHVGHKDIVVSLLT